MDKERVKFYNRSDYFYSYMLNKALEKLRIFDFSKESDSLEEVLELYNIIKYIDDDAKSLVVNEGDKKLLNILSLGGLRPMEYRRSLGLI